MNPSSFNISNQPLDFYLINKNDFINIFNKPIRPNLNNNF